MKKEWTNWDSERGKMRKETVPSSVDDGNGNKNSDNDGDCNRR